MELIIEKPGSKFGVKDGLFYVKFEDVTNTFAVSNIKTVIFSDNASITTSAIKLALDNDIEMIFVDKTNKPYGRILSSQFNKSGALRQCQYKLFNNHAGLSFSKNSVLKKINTQEDHLKDLMEKLKAWDDNLLNKINSLKNEISKIKEKEKILSSIR